MNKLQVAGKGVFIWRPQNIHRGDPQKIADELVKAGVSIVAIKIHDGWFVYEELLPVIAEIRRRGIKVGGWGYIYFIYNVQNEIKAALRAIRLYSPDFYLIDAEKESYKQYANAKTFAAGLRAALPDLPIGMCSYWKPSYHPTVPWNELRAICDFDAPQVYWRGYLPTGKLMTSKKEYSLMPKKLPFTLPCGDMYYEHNIKPTPQQVKEFLEACENDPEIQGVLMWSMDQMTRVPELWAAFSEYRWGEVAAPIAVPGTAKLTKRLVLPAGVDVKLIGETQTHYNAQFFIDKPYFG